MRVYLKGDSSASANSGNISVKRIRHIVHETLAPTRLSTKEVGQFTAASGIKMPQKIKVDDGEAIVPTAAVIRNLMNWRKFSGNCTEGQKMVVVLIIVLSIFIVETLKLI